MACRRLGLVGAAFWVFAAVYCNAVPLREMIDRDPNLSEANLFMSKSSVLDDIDADDGGTVLTILLPDNQAWNKLPTARRTHLLDPANKDDLETMLLFSSTDAAILKNDTFNGMRIVSLLGVEAEVDRSNNRICVLSIHDEARYQCAKIIGWDRVVDEGVVHIIDNPLLPEELLEVFNELGI